MRSPRTSASGWPTTSRRATSTVRSRATSITTARKLSPSTIPSSGSTRRTSPLPRLTGRWNAGALDQCSGQRSQQRQSRVPAEVRQADPPRRRCVDGAVDPERLQSLHHQLGDPDPERRPGRQPFRPSASFARRQDQHQHPELHVLVAAGREPGDQGELPQLRTHQQDQPLRRHRRCGGLAGSQLERGDPER